mgnify:CR=1 FL=1
MLNSMILVILLIILPLLYSIATFFVIKKAFNLSFVIFSSLAFDNFIFTSLYFLIKHNSILLLSGFTPLFLVLYCLSILVIHVTFVGGLLGLKNFLNTKKPIYYYRIRTILVGGISIGLVMYFYWYMAYMPGITFQQFMFNLIVPTGTANVSFWVHIFPLALQIGTVIISWAVTWITQPFLVAINRSNKRLALRLNRILANGAVVIVLVLALSFPITEIQLYKVFGYFSQENDFMKVNYVNPNDVSLKFPAQKQNLVTIFVESFEATYFDKSMNGAAASNLLPELTEWVKKGDTFSNTEKQGGALPLSGATWSIAGEVAYLSGIPLLLPIDGNSYGGSGSFLPGLVNLGDILLKEGYSQHMIIGSESDFAGTDTYYKNHGNFSITDINTVKQAGKLPQDYREWWGFEDSKLYGFAKEELNDIASKPDPFHYVMITTDTHFPDGYLDKSCDSSSALPYENSIRCADKQLSEFLSWVQEQDFAKETTIVIVGDHISMDRSYFATINSSYQRSTFNLILNSKADKTEMVTNDRVFTAVDYFPTIVASLGVQIEGDRLGLGMNLYSGKQTLAERVGIEILNQNLPVNDNWYTQQFIMEDSNE